MSLVIDALRKAQQLRLKDGQGIPFFKPQQPSRGEKRRRSGKRRVFLIPGLALLLFILWIVLWNPFSSFQGKKPNPSAVFSEKNKPSIAVAEKTPEETVKVLPPPLQEEALPGKESPEIKKEEPLSKQVEKERKPRISKPTGRSRVSKPSPPSAAISSQPLEISSPSKVEAPLPPANEAQEVRKPVPPSPEILTLFNQGVLYQNQKETAKAIQAYQGVIELDPAYVEAYNNLGLLYQETGDFGRAYQAYQRSLEINPLYEKALNNLGILFYLQGRYEEALKSFQKALAVHPENMESYLNLGILFKKEERWDEAIDSFQKALAINPASGEAHYNLALLYEQMNQLDLAIDQYQKFIQLSSKTYPVLASKVQRHLDALSRRIREKSK